MSLIITIVVALIVVALALYLVDLIPALPAPIPNLLKILIVILALFYVLRAAGMV